MKNKYSSILYMMYYVHMNIKAIICAPTITCYHNIHICSYNTPQLEINNEMKKPFSFAYDKRTLDEEIANPTRFINYLLT